MNFDSCSHHALRRPTAPKHCSRDFWLHVTNSVKRRGLADATRATLCHQTQSYLDTVRLLLNSGHAATTADELPGANFLDLLAHSDRPGLVAFATALAMLPTELTQLEWWQTGIIFKYCSIYELRIASKEKSVIASYFDPRMNDAQTY